MSDKKTNWGTVFLVLGAGILAGAHVGKVPPALPVLRGELGIDLVGAGWIVSVFSVTIMTIGTLAGMFGDRFGFRHLLMGGLAAMAAGGLGGGLAADASMLLLARFVEGIGFLSVSVAAPALIVEVAAAGDRKLALGIWTAYMPAGAAPMMVMTPFLIQWVGWRGLWIALAVAAALWIGVLAAGMGDAGARRPRPAEQGSPWRDLRMTASRLGPWLGGAGVAAFIFQWVPLIVWLPTFLVEERGAAPFTAAALTALIFLATVPGNLFGGWLLHRGFAFWTLLLGANLGTAILGIGIFAEGFPDLLRYGLCLVFSFVGGVTPVVAFAGAAHFAPSPRQLGVSNGMMVQLSHVAHLSGPPAVALMVTVAGGWQVSLWFILTFAAIGAGIGLLMRVAERRSPSTA